MPELSENNPQQDFFQALSSLSNRVGQVEATLESFGGILRDLRADQRSSGVNWLGILGLIVSIVVPVGTTLGVVLILSSEPQVQMLELHEKRLDQMQTLILERAERIADLEAHEKAQDRINQRYWDGLFDSHSATSEDKDHLERQAFDEIRLLVRDIKRDTNERLGRLETAMGHLRAAFPKNLPGNDESH